MRRGKREYLRAEIHALPSMDVPLAPEYLQCAHHPVEMRQTDMIAIEVEMRATINCVVAAAACPGAEDWRGLNAHARDAGKPHVGQYRRLRIVIADAR
jgi:hypothetical protein